MVKKPHPSKRLNTAIHRPALKTMESNIENTDLTVSDQNENKILNENAIVVDKFQLKSLMVQNQDQKAEIGVLVGLFLNFETLFTGEVNTIKLISMIPKLLSDATMKAQIEAVLPIIEKYKA